MNLTELAVKLQGSIRDEQLELSEATLGPGDAARLLSGVAGGPFKVRGARVSSVNGRVVVNGTSSFLGVADMPVTATFVAAGERTECSLLAALPASWNFAQSFPGLPPYVNLSPEFASQPRRPSFLYEMAFSDPHFVLATYDHREEQLGADVEAGLNFVAGVDPSGPLEMLGLLAGSQRLTLSGTIERDADAPALFLLARAQTNAQVGPVALEGIEALLYSSLLGAAEGGVCGIELRCNARLGDSVTLELASDIPIGSTDRLAIRGEFENLNLPGLGAFEAVTGGESLDALLPPQLQSLPDLSIDSFHIDFSPRGGKINEVGFTVKTAGPWDLDFLTVSGIGLDFKVVSPLNKPARKFLCMLFGKAEISGGQVDVCAFIPDLQLSAALVEGQSINLAGFLQQLSGGDFEVPGELSITRLALDAAPGDKLYSFDLGVSGEWGAELGGTSLAMQDIAMGVNYQGGPTTSVTGYLKGTADLGGVLVSMRASSAPGQGWTFKGEINELGITQIAESFLDKSALPDEVPDITFTNLSVSVTPRTGAFSLGGTCAVSWDLPFGAEGLAVATTDIALQRGAATGTGAQRRPGQLTCSLKLSGTGPVQIVEGLTFESFSLGFDLLGQNSWSLDGAVAATIFDAAYTLAAGLDQTPTSRKISLRVAVAADSPLVSFGGAGSLDVDEVAVIISKGVRPGAGGTTSAGAGAGTSPNPNVTQPAGTAPPGGGAAAGGGAVSLSASSPYAWEVTATGSVKATNVFTLAGTLQLYNYPDRKGLAFKATDAEVAIPLPVPAQSMKLHLGLAYISVVRTTAGAGAAAAGWAFDAAAGVWFTGLPKSIQAILAQKVTGRFKIDGTGTQVSVDRVLQPLELEPPAAKVGDANIKLGTMLLDASNLMLRVQGGSLTLSMDFGVGLPESLNDVFGKKADGTPSVRFFNTYVKGKPETVTKFRLGITTSGGLTIQPVTSPIAAVRVVMEGADAWWHIDLGEFGKAKLMVPVFGYTGDSFVARGGFQQVEPLKVPLTPFKLLLSACGLGAAADALPAGIPLQEIQLYDEGRKDFQIDEFLTTLERLGGFSLPPEVKDALRFIEGRLDLLPDRFKSYLDVEIPERFEFSFAVRPDGGASGRVWVQGDKPIKLLYPTAGLAGPQLNGIELYGLTFGEMLGGSLVFLRVDARVDQFDLLMLAAALALPLEQLPILPSTRALSRRFIIKDLFMFIVYQAGIPVPVPLFYDELGLEYLGIEGVEFQTHWNFPKPSLSPTDALAVFNNFKRFFTEHDYLLDADAPPQDFDLKLTVGPNYLALPKYLGGKALGSKDGTTVISAYESLAHLLNALKTLSLNEIVRALPLDKRVGREQVKFAAMALEIDWLITTPQEFRQLSYRQLKVADGEIEDILRIVPAAPGRDVQGLVVLLKGSWQIADAFSLATCFGMVGTGGGFATGLSIDGKLSELLAVEMSGTVVIDTKGPTYFALNGHSALAVLDRQVFVGDVQIDDDSFYLEGRLDVFPPSSPLQIGGGAKLTIDGGGQVYFHGAANVSLQNFVLQSSEVTVTNTSLEVSGSWLGRTVTFSIVVQGRDFILSGSVTFDLALKCTTGPVYEPTTGLKLTDGINLDTSANASLAVSLGTFGFAAEIDASFRWEELQLKVPHFRVDASPADLKQLADTVGRQVSEKASEIFADVYKSVGAWLEAGVAGVVRLSREWGEAVSAAGQWGRAAWDATSRWSTKAWQSAYRWNAGAWRATTQWSEQAWRATAQWGDDAWDATVSWTDDAWDATTRWSDDAWRASTGWSKEGWQATTRWSAGTWEDTTRWTKEVWGNTAGWTTSEWNDATDTVEKFFKSIHGDVSFIPHIDTNFIPHGDAKLIPHADVKLIPHIDAGAKSHGDVSFVPHGDVKLIPHGDVKLIPHADFYSIPHGDVKGTHVDVAKKKVAGVTVVPHGDSRVGHIDTPRTGHVDTPSAAHVDTPSTGHLDTPATAHLDTPSVLHGDTPSTAHIDTPATAHIDTPATAHGDTPAQAHIDTP